MKANIDMINSKILPNMFRFVIPIMLSAILQTLYNAADSLVIGHYEGPLALGAVGSSGTIINTIITLFFGLSLGTNVLVAKNFGAGNKRGVKRAADMGIIVAVTSGLFVTPIGIIFTRPITELVGLDSQIIDMAVTYIRIFFLSIPFASLYNYIAAILMGIGDSKKPMICSITSGIVNVVFNIIFVKFFHMGVTGVATATVISTVLSVVLITIALKQSTINYKFRYIRFNGQMLKNTLKVGLPSGLQNLLFGFSNTITTSGVNSLGAACVAAHSIVAQPESIAWAAGNAVTQATIPFAGQNVGADKPKRLNKILYSGWFLYFIIVFTISMASYLLRTPIIKLFAGDSAGVSLDEITKFALIKFYIVMIPYFFVGLMDIPSGMLRGMGKTTVSLIMSIVGIGGVRICWLLFVFPIFHTAEALYIIYPISWITTGIVLTIAYFKAKRKMFPKVDEEAIS